MEKERNELTKKTINKWKNYCEDAIEGMKWKVQADAISLLVEEG